MPQALQTKVKTRTRTAVTFLAAVFVLAAGLVLVKTSKQSPKTILQNMDKPKPFIAAKLNVEKLTDVKNSVTAHNKTIQNLIKIAPKVPNQKYEQALEVYLKKRRQDFIELMRNDPASAVSASLPLKIRSTLPKSLQNLVETRGKFQGKLAIQHKDDFDNNTSRNTFFLFYKNKWEPLYLAKFPKILSGATIKVDGALLEGGSIAAEQVEVVAPAEEITAEEKKLAIFLVNFQNGNPLENDFIQIAQDAYCGSGASAKKFYQGASYEQVTFSCIVYGIVDLSVQGVSVFADEPWNSLTSAAASSGLDLSNIDYQVIIADTPSGCHGWNLLGSLGGLDLGRGFIDADCLEFSTPAQVPAHELGHGFGVLHAGKLDCPNNLSEMPQELSNLNECQVSEYGDNQDVMGNSLKFFGADHRDRMNWLTSQNILTVTQEGTYTQVLTPISAPGTGVKQIRVPLGNNHFYSIEYRTPTSTFENASGALVRYIPENFVSMQGGGVDTLRPGNFILGSGDNSTDPTGGVFNDAIRNFAIVLTEKTPDHATVLFNVPALKPDLIVQDINLTSVSDGSFGIQATIKNIGSADVPTNEPINIRFELDKISAGGFVTIADVTITSGGLPAGSSIMFPSAPINMSSSTRLDTRAIRVTVDPLAPDDDLIDEFNENNNSKTKNTPPVDIVLDEIQFVPQTDGRFQSLIRVTNAGSAEIQSSFEIQFIPTFRSVSPLNTELWVDIQYDEAIPAGATRDIVGPTYTAEELRNISRVTAIADSQSAIFEINEFNNFKENRVYDLFASLVGSAKIVLQGETVTYTAIVTETGEPSGEQTLPTNLVVTLPQGLNFNSVNTTQGSCANSNGVVTCALGQIQNGASATVNISAIAAKEGKYRVQAEISAEDEEGIDFLLANNMTSVDTVVSKLVDLAVGLMVPAIIIVPGQFSYNAAIKNSGPNEASGIEIKTTVPTGLLVISATTPQGQCTIRGGQAQCNLRNLPANGSASVKFGAQANTGGAKTITLSAKARENDRNSANNSTSKIVNSIRR